VSRPQETPIVIAGAGPTGLALANCLAGQGVNFVLVDKLAAPQTTSRAAAIHARTLEVLEPLGVTDALVGAGFPIQTVVLQDRDKTLMRVGFDQIPSRYQYILALPQNETEAILTQRLTALGGTVERDREVVAVVQDGSGATVTVQDAAGSRTMIRARYVVGADGYHSVVRQAAGIGFAASTYAETFILADVHMDWTLPPGDMRLFLAPEGLALVVPFGGGRFRIVATVPKAPPNPSRSDVQSILDQRGPRAAPVRVTDVLWSSHFRIHHGVARRYRAGRIFLAGDAAHVHSPAGGQGMNIGIQDAVALGDRLADVIAGRQPDAYLDEYEQERRPIAERVVAMTDQMTRMGTLTGPVGQQLRNIGLTVAGHLPFVRRRIATRMAELGQP